MKRCIRLAAGIIMLLATALMLGMNLTVFADGDNPPAVTGDPSASNPPQSDAKRHRPAPPLNKSAATDTDITKDTTITASKTYNTNLWIYSTYTIASNVNVVVNGDLYIYGALIISKGTLTVNGDIWVFGGLKACGTGKIVVNKAPKVLWDGDAYQYGGNFCVVDEEDLDSILVVQDSAAITVNYAYEGGFYIDYGARFYMTSAAAKVTVYNYCYMGGESTRGTLTAGTLEVVNGGFYQDNSTSDYSFCPHTSFKVILRETNYTARTVKFDSPSYSFFQNLTVSGYVFASDSFVPLYKELASDYSINCNNATLQYQGNLNGKKLTLTARVVEFGPDTDTALGGGTLTVNGTVLLNMDNRLVMNNSGDRLIINGTLDSLYPDTAVLTNGIIELNGNFYEEVSFSDFKPGPDLTVRISGANRLVHFDSPGYSYFTKFEVAPGTTFRSGSVVSVNCTQAKDADWRSVPTLYLSGNLGGHTLMTNNLIIQTVKELVIGGGKLIVEGNMTTVGALKMLNENDFVSVAGDYVAVSGAGFVNLTAGTVCLQGNMTIQSDFSYQTYSSHRTVLCGDRPQTITGLGTYSHFGTLIIANDSVKASDFSPGCYSSLIRTGTTLSGIVASAGTLLPAFSESRYSYMLVLPADITDATLTPSIKAGYSGSEYITVGTDGTHITETTVTGVPLNGSKTVTIWAHALDNVKATATTVKVERVNPSLKAGAAGLGALPAGAVATGADTAFTVHMPATMASLSFAPALDNPDSTLKIDGGAATKIITIGVGASFTCHVVVTAQDGTTKKTYDVTFTRHKPLASLTSSTGGMTFNPATASYNIVTAASSATVTAVASADCNGVVTMNGEATLSKTIPLTPGTPAKVTVTAKDATGNTTTTYTVNFNSVRLLSGIKLSKGSLSPAFKAGTFTYNVNLPNKTTSIVVTPQKTSSCSSMKINGKKATSVKLSPKPGGKATATITCTYGSGAGALTQTYTVNVYRIQPVSKISLSTGRLSPGFSATKYSYKVSLPASASSVTVYVAKTASCKSLTINGIIATSVKLYPAAGGSATAKVVATAQNGAKYTYTITVKRAAMLKLIKLSSGKLSPAFNPLVTTYNVTVPSTTAQVTVTPAKMSGVKSMLINGKPAKSVVLKPAVGDKATATITLTAGSAKTTYTVTIHRGE